MKTLSGSFLYTLVALVLSSCATSDTNTMADQARALNASPHVQALHGKARTNGSIRVIAGVSVNYLADQEFGIPANQAHRDELDRARSALIEATRAKGITTAIPLHNLPYILFDVSASELRHLTETGKVISLEENLVFGAPALETRAGPDTGISPAAAAPSVPGPAYDWSSKLINAPAAWELGVTGTGQTIAILDSGVDFSHISMKGKAVGDAEACFSTNVVGLAQSTCPNKTVREIGPGSGANCTETIQCGHGTAVAGLAAGVSIRANGQLYTGIAPGAKLVSIQIGTLRLTADLCKNLTGGAPPCLSYEIHNTLEAVGHILDLAKNQPISAINMSIGGGSYAGYCDSTSRILFAAIAAARKIGIPTFVASGNDGNTDMVNFPACMSNVVSVGGTGQDGKLYEKSNWAAFLSTVAPGANVLAPVIDFKQKEQVQYNWVTGTSFAAPQAAGAWALLKSTSRYKEPIPDPGLPPQSDNYPSYFQRMGKPVQGPGQSKVYTPMVFIQMWSDPITVEGPRKVAGQIGGEPDCVTWGPSRIDCFAKGNTNDQMYQIFWNGAAWSEWKTWTGQLNQKPSCTAIKGVTGRIDCFMWGFDAKLWNLSMRGSVWGQWQSLDGTNITSVPDCRSPASGTNECYARWGEVGTAIPNNALSITEIKDYKGGKDGKITFTSKSLGGALGSPPDCLSRQKDYRECWARNDKGILAHTHNNNMPQWAAWQSLESGTQIIGTPSCVSTGPDQLDCFARNTSSQMMRISWAQGGHWGSWVPHIGTLTDDPYCVSRASNRIDCFASISPTGALVHKAWNGTDWTPAQDQGWAPLGGAVATSRVNCVSPAQGQLECFYRRADDALGQASWGAWRAP